MDAKKVILGSLKQSWGYLTGALDGLTQKEFAFTPGPECNSIAFILWHIARVEDFFVSRVIKREKEVYEEGGWREKMGTPAKEIGYQYTVEQLRDWPVPKIEDLRNYANAVREKTLDFLNSIPPEKLDEVPRPDRSPDPIGDTFRLVITEIALHVGQICYLRGMQRGLNK